MRKLEHGLRAGFRTRTLTRTGWLASAGRASVVLAVVAGTLAAGCAAPTSRSVTAAAAPLQPGIPRYYVELDIKGPITTYGGPVAVAVVRVTTTGMAIARVSAPRPYKGFTAVTGAADDRTFVLLANAPTDPFTGATPERFFVLRIDPHAPSAAARARLTPFPARDVPGGPTTKALVPGQEQVGPMALSPDGRSLAAVLAVGDESDLYVFNLASTKPRSWIGKPCTGCAMFLLYGMSTLSWTSDSKSLAFTFEPSGPDISQLRLLHVGSRGSDVQASSTPFIIHAPVPYWRQAVMTPDGKTVFLKLTLPGPDLYTLGSFSLMRFSLDAGQHATINTLPMIETAGYATSGPLTADTILWTNDNGSKVIIADARPGHTLGVYSGGRYTPLPWPAHAVGAAW